jgi:hypothetical protein
MSITENIFLAGNVAPWFSYIVIKPHGTGHFLNGVTVTGNKFRAMNGVVERAERVDTSFADLNYGRTKNVNFAKNTYHNVPHQPTNPLRVTFESNSAYSVWGVPTDGGLPFGGYARGVDSVVLHAGMVDSSNNRSHTVPHILPEQGANKDQVNLEWQYPVRGTVTLLVRMDK